jgi:hypothetical protein
VDHKEVDCFLHAFLILRVLSRKEGILLFEDAHKRHLLSVLVSNLLIFSLELTDTEFQLLDLGIPVLYPLHEGLFLSLPSFFQYFFLCLKLLHDGF